MIKGNTKTVNIGMNLSPQKLITCSSTVHIGICNDCGSVADWHSDGIFSVLQDQHVWMVAANQELKVEVNGDFTT